MNFSREQALRIASFVVMFSALFGVNLQEKGVDESTLTEFLITGALIVGMVIDAIGYAIRFAKGDVNIFGARR